MVELGVSWRRDRLKFWHWYFPLLALVYSDGDPVTEFGAILFVDEVAILVSRDGVSPAHCRCGVPAEGAASEVSAAVRVEPVTDLI